MSSKFGTFDLLIQSISAAICNDLIWWVRLTLKPSVLGITFAKSASVLGLEIRLSFERRTQNLDFCWKMILLAYKLVSTRPYALISRCLVMRCDPFSVRIVFNHVPLQALGPTGSGAYMS